MSGPYAVAVTRWARPLEKELPALAEMLGVAAYDLRLRAAGPLPVILARTTDVEEGQALLAALRARGHGSIACDLSAVAASGEMACPKTFALGDAELIAEVPGAGEVRVGWGEVLALVVATQSVEAETRSRTEGRKLSLGRAALSGGLMMTKKVTKESKSRSEERVRVVYLFRRTGRDTVLLREHALRYQGLGERMGRTSAESFTTLLAALRERAPEALYDDRLLSQRRGASVAVSGTTAQQVVSHSNAGEVDLAAHLLAVAHLRGQL